MKKSFISFSLITLSLTFVLSLASCSNLFSKGSNDETESQTATFIGNINIDSLLGSDFVTKNSRSARPEPINIGTGYKYFVKAEDNNNLTYTSEDSESRIQLSGNTFEATLPYGTWTITVSIRENNSTDDILKNTLPEQILNAASPTFQYDFFLKPVTEGTGDFSLRMYVNKKAGITEEDSNYVNKLEVTMLYKPVGASLSDTELSLSADKTFFTYCRASSTETVKPGTYKILFTFKHGDTPVFSTLQAINIVRGLITNTWVGGTSTLIKPDGTFELTEELIKAWRLRRTDYYVGGTGASDSNTGSHDDPLAKIKHAVALVNDINYGDTEVKIHVADNLVEELETTGININTGKKILIDIQNGVTTAPVLKRTSSLSGALIKVNNGAELTINGININGNQIPSSANCGVYIYNGGTFTLKSGKITENWNSYTDGTGAGIYNAGVLNLYGGEISSNKVTGDNGLGGGIYSQGTINLKGAVTIKNNKDSNNENSNLYLSSGKKITITGPLEEGTNKSEIYISTADAVTKDSSVTFTEDYGFYGTGYNAGKFPGRYFIGENATVTYKHATDVTAPEAGDGEAQIAVSSGQIIDPLSDIDVTFSLSKNKFMEGSDASEALRTIKIIPKYVINSAPLSGTALEAALAETNWKINMYVGDIQIDDCSWTDPTILIPASVTYHDTYTLVVRATYKGITFDKEFVINDSSPFVQTGSYSWTGTAAEVAAITPTSSVFISGRTLNIPSLIACDHEVTQGEYEKYCDYNADKPYEGLGKGPNYPAYYVTWYNAILYCNLCTLNDPTFGSTRNERLSHCVYAISDNKDPDTWYDINITNGKYCAPSSSNSAWNETTFDQAADGWRLPTEAEWEFLARGGNIDNYKYSGSNDINEVAWYAENSGINGGNTNKTTHEVKGKKANSLGLYDMNGNVWEWCWDWNGTINSSTGYTGVSSGTKRMLGGGSWYSPDSRDIVNHNCEFPYSTNDGLGLRVVRTVTE